jgi:hypothetical protein
MQKSVFAFIIAGLIILSTFIGCEKESNYRFKGKEDTSESTGDDTLSMDNYPKDGSLAFSENFQQWKRDGYVESIRQDCEMDIMTSNIIMYRPDKPVVRNYIGFQVSYSLQDFAVNPECGNMAGTSSPESDISVGYVALQSEIFYECGGHNSDALMQLSELPSVSRISFAISYGGDTAYVGGLTLWKKSSSDSKFIRVGDFQPGIPSVGEIFTVDLNEKDVLLKFTPALSDKGIGVNDGVHANRNVRIHGLWVWSIKDE